MKKVLVAVATAAMLLTSVAAEAHGRRHRHSHGGSSGIDTTTLLLLGAGGLAAPTLGFGATAFAGQGAGGFSAILPLLLLQQMDRNDRRGRRR